MGKILCKIWMFILKAVDAILDGIVNVIKDLVGYIVEIISAIWEGVKTVFSGSGSWIMWGLLGLGAWYLFGGDDDDEDKQDQNRAQQYLT